MHVSTGMSPYELALTRNASVPIVESNLAKDPSTATKAEFRVSFLEQLELIGRTTRETLHQAQQRYKEVFDRHVRVRNADITAGDLVLLKTFEQPAGLSPKLLSPTSCPYAVLDVRHNRFLIRTNVGDIWFNSSCVKKCTLPSDLPADVDYVEGALGSEQGSPTSEDEIDLNAERQRSGAIDVEDVGDTTEYVVDRLVDYGHDDSGELLFKVRWYACGSDQDTWNHGPLSPT